MLQGGKEKCLSNKKGLPVLVISPFVKRRDDLLPARWVPFAPGPSVKGFDDIKKNSKKGPSNNKHLLLKKETKKAFPL